MTSWLRALLNVMVRVPAYYALLAARPRLEAWLAEMPIDARLDEADPDGLSLLGELFAVIDDGEVPGVRATTLAKIMHRKRPSFVPLYDRYVWHTYVGAPDARIVRSGSRRRSWREFMRLLAGEMAEDLRRERLWLSEVSSLATGPVPITALRALDIVAWQAGRILAAETGAATAPGIDDDDVHQEQGEGDHGAAPLADLDPRA